MPVSAPSGALRHTALALALAALAACSADPGPSWSSLAFAFQPRTLAQQVAEWEHAAGAPTGTRSEPQAFGLGLVHPVAAEAWRPAEVPGCYGYALPAGALAACGVAPRLVGRGREYPAAEAGRELAPGEVRREGKRLLLRLPAATNVVPRGLLVLETPGAAASEQALPSSAWRVGEGVGLFVLELPPAAARADGPAPRLFAELVPVEEERALAPFEYRVDERHLTLCWPGDGPPPAMQLAVRLENGREQDGSWQLRLGRFCGNGIPVWSGGREELVRDVPPSSALSFRFVHGGRARAGEVRARVRLDGEVLFERTFAPGAEPQHVSVPLPPAGVRGARLAFELEGAPGLGAFFAPTIGPLARGAPGARPWPTRPDLVLFVADTLRADVLAPYGGDPKLAPELARFAADSLRFTQARSNAAWTLPSIGSMLTGLHPGQHGATDEDLTLPDFHATLPEQLALAGYRTGAITDGSFFAPVFGLAQGFEWFSQRDAALWDLDQTLAEARAFLAQDDGRPVFLVVHTYRVHQPYRVGPEEDRSAYDALLERARLEIGTSSPEATAGFGALARHADELGALYEAGVRDLDRATGAFLAELEAARFFEHGFLAFTSDHGEALGENAEFFHGRTLWEVKLRVPLFLRGPGLAPRDVAFSAGPIDLVPTFAELAGLPGDPDWVGRSLVSLDEERPSFAFQLARKGRQIAIREGTRKVLLAPERALLESGTCAHAFELDRDPAEAHDLAANEAWPGELTRRLAPAVLGYLEPRGAGQAAGVSPELRAELEALGYGGQQDEPAPTRGE